uniref:Uncharacterized protein n=1 Tax=Melopsittacus undulatus TaxID=13146 RepID=A0A8V5GNS4_MELUD
HPPACGCLCVPLRCHLNPMPTLVLLAPSSPSPHPPGPCHSPCVPTHPCAQGTKRGLWTRLWRLSVALRAKLSPHSTQMKGSCPSWTLWLELQLKLLPQSPQRYGFSPVWVRRCCTRCEFWLKLLPHSPQVLGRSPV